MSSRSSIMIFSKRPYVCQQCAQKQRRAYNKDSLNPRQRLSKIWAPTIIANRTADDKKKPVDIGKLLVHGSFIAQAHSGIFHLLPMGLRVQQKLEALADKQMLKLGASKLALSSISSEALWNQSGRLQNSKEILRVGDRRGSKLILSPTHEEEITNLVKSTRPTYRELPLKLYQVSRKYRDELRPRGGLLRAKEFLMKDLYTFDLTVLSALRTYKNVTAAYRNFFEDLGIPYLVAQASSGDMGGKLSHEFHFPHESGEDIVVECKSCGHISNDEIYQPVLPPAPQINDGVQRLANENAKVWRGISTDYNILVEVFIPPGKECNVRALTGLVPRLNTSVDPVTAPHLWNYMCFGVQPPDEHANVLVMAKSASRSDLPPRKIRVVDATVNSPSDIDELPDMDVETISVDAETGAGLVLTVPTTGDKCGHCGDGEITAHRTIEVGHMFHLGQRYSKALGANVVVPANFIYRDEESTDTVPDLQKSLGEIPSNPEPGKLLYRSTTVKKNSSYERPDVAPSNFPLPKSISNSVDTASSSNLDLPKSNKPQTVPLQMGCHGLGLSRLMAASASIYSSGSKLHWPRQIAPFEVVVIAAAGQIAAEVAAEEAYDLLAKRLGPKWPLPAEAARDPSSPTYIGHWEEDPDILEQKAHAANPNHAPRPPLDVVLDDRGTTFGQKFKDAEAIGYPVWVIVGGNYLAKQLVDIECPRLGVQWSVTLEQLREQVEVCLKYVDSGWPEQDSDGKLVKDEKI